VASRDPLEEEFREFVAARSAALLRTAYLLAGDWATAEDLLQTALTKTYLAWKRLGGIEAIEPYARRVMVNTSTSWWRRRWHGERPTEVLPERAGVDEIEQQLDRDLLWRHLTALPTRQRAVLVLRFYEDMSEAQTAALLNISAGTVKSQTSRALTTLRRRMGADAPDLAQGGPSAVGRRPARPAAGRRTPDPAGAPSAPAAPARPSGVDAGRSVGAAAGRVPSADDATAGQERVAPGPRPASVRPVPRPAVPAPVEPAADLPVAPPAVPVGTGTGERR
jgi:RNA polymerase sigma-70 factor (sigma-E family)